MKQNEKITVIRNPNLRNKSSDLTSLKILYRQGQPETVTPNLQSETITHNLIIINSILNANLHNINM